MTATEITGHRLILLNIALCLGTFIQILDSSIANVAIPYIAGGLGASVDEGTWVITSFSASNAIVLPLTGWLADYFGRVRLFVVSVFLFSLASFCCGFSSNLTMLVFFRVLQGAVAGSLIPLSQTLLIASNPPSKRGAVLGLWSTIVIVAPVIGPVLGGYITQEYSWSWIFYINVPIGIFSCVLVWYFLKDHETPLVRNPIDWTGLILLSIGVACLQIMLDKGKDLDWFESNAIITLAIVSAISFCYFGIWTYYQKYPIVDFSFFKNRNFAVGTVMVTLGYLIFFGSTVTIALWLQTEQNYTAYWAGIAVAPIGIVPIFTSILLGKNLHRVNLRMLVAASFTLFALGFFYQKLFITQVDLNTVMLSRFLQGFGLSIFFLPLVQLSLGGVSKERYARASGLYNFIRILVGSGFGTSLSIEIWTRMEIFHHERLSESINIFRTPITQVYSALGEQRGLSHEVINKIIDKSVEQQAFILSTNNLSFMAVILFLLMVPFIFLCKPVKPEGPVEISSD